MSTSMRDLVDGEAELDDEEGDESFDEETGNARPRAKKGGELDDSSEEDEEDEDEEEARRIREGFIVDEEEEEDEADDDEQERRKKKKRRRAEREEEEQLDEEDLDLIGESIPEWQRRSQAQPTKFKRLKRGHREEDRGADRQRLAEIFSDDEDDREDERYSRPSHRAPADEFDDFIEDDYPEDDEERIQRQQDLEVARPREKGLAIDKTGLDQDAIDDMEAIFGDGHEYEWVLAMEEEEDDTEKEKQNIELRDVFEPSQLQEKMLTEEDNEIRVNDEPERFQIDRKPFKNLQITAEQFKEEAWWITNLIWPKKGLAAELKPPFQRAVGKVLEFFVTDGVEAPYVYQHRRDYLIHAVKTRNPHHGEEDELEFTIEAEKLLNQDDLWQILELDIKFRSMIEKRNTLERSFDNLKAGAAVQDSMLEHMIPDAQTMEELQDIQDYVNFRYSAQLRDLAAAGSGSGADLKRPGSRTALFERTRHSPAYRYVQALGITPDRLARNAMRDGKKVLSEDDAKPPMDLADSLANTDFTTGQQVMHAARQMYAEELYFSPRMRKHFRAAYYNLGLFNCRRTEKGLRKIDESHPYYEIKYLVNQTIGDFVLRPELFLKLMRAEEEGLIEVRLYLENEREFRKQLYNEFVSDNFSDLADAWNAERGKVLDMAFGKLERVVTRGVKESLRTACQDELLKTCRKEYFNRLDQAPLKPKGMVNGTVPRVLALSNGMGDLHRDPTMYVFVDEDGKLVDQGKFVNLGRDETQRSLFASVVEKRRPDVVVVSGFSAETHRLVRDLEALIHEKGLTATEYDDPELGEYRSEMLDVVVVNDEVARLYKDSPRGEADNPLLPALTRYCIGLAKYMQNPMGEYAALGKDVTSLLIHPYQQYLPQDKLLKHLETAMVDMVNICGVNINDAMRDPYKANLLPYLSGLGPRKAQLLIKGINANGGVVGAREELVGDPERHKLPVLGPRVWNNCASFLFIEYEPTHPDSDPLDNTRIHPEDYDLARKVAADALGLDEEDIKAETDENGPSAIIRKLFRDDDQSKVNELILEEYAEQLAAEYQQRKRATLETIRAELLGSYDELRKPYAKLPADQIFTMFTGETRDSLCEGMIVPVNVRVVKDDFAIVRLDCGIEGRVESHEVSHRHIKDMLHQGQTVQAKILELNEKDFVAKLSIREDELRRPYRRRVEHSGQWDFRLEDGDREELREKDKVTGRTQRVVKHPLFKPFNGVQAEEFLGSLPAGEVVIRPSSKGNDHLAITWKVADGVFQHIDVLELQKDNEFSVGRQLRVGGKHTYSDLDELIVEHVKAMAKKVEELVQHEKFQKGSRADVERWLATYVDANPTRSAYAFCLDTRHPGFFFLCFKASRSSKVYSWMVRVVPHAYELFKSQYPDMRALCNGFKLRYSSESMKQHHHHNGGGGHR